MVAVRLDDGVSGGIRPVQRTGDRNRKAHHGRSRVSGGRTGLVWVACRAARRSARMARTWARRSASETRSWISWRATYPADGLWVKVFMSGSSGRGLWVDLVTTTFALRRRLGIRHLP